jgi:hypothetical protein
VVKTVTMATTAAAMTVAAVTVVAAAELTAVAALATAVMMAPTMAAIVVAAATVTATAVGGKDNGGNGNGRGHRQQSTKIGSKDTVEVVTVLETAAAGAVSTAAGAPMTAQSVGADGITFATAWELWVLVVMVVCGVVHAGCVCAARPCCFVRLTPMSASKIWQTTAYWGSPER